jgi:diaminopimelate decarboxylase
MTHVPLDRFRALDTPFYYYDTGVLARTLDGCHAAAARYGFHVHYALKANAEPRLLNVVRAAGFGADCVSGGEVARALECGFPPDKVVFAGVGKTDADMRAALAAGIFCFNVESFQELETLDVLAGALGVRARVALRLNPDIDAKTHHHITTGLGDNKFGISSVELPDCIDFLGRAAHSDFVGIHVHIGSQITDMNVFRKLCARVNDMVAWFTVRGLNLRIVNVGGGLGVDYHNPGTAPDFDAYFRIFHDHLKRPPQTEIHFELGRALVAGCGVLVSRVLYVKRGDKKNFVVLDAGMTELMRPALYQAYHKIENTTARGGTKKYDIVGPICESTDIFGRDVPLGDTQRGDIVVIHTAGAYGQVMASTYNLRALPPSVFSDT